jgi:ketosteroid isomerase-like protein
MKKFSYFLAIVAIFFSSTAFTFGPDTDVTEANKAVFKAMGDEDGNSLENLTDSDFTFIGADGVAFDRETVLMGIRGGYATFDVSDVESAAVKIIGDAAYVTGTWKSKGQIQGASFDYRACYTTIFIKRGTGWKLSLIQFTVIK